MDMTFAVIGLAAALAAAQAPPFEHHGLHYETPAMVWDEAFPLGNGTLGALVWGDGRPLNISLDRTDLWDLRPVPEYSSEDYRYDVMRQWEREGRYEELVALYETPYHRPAPTKIPAGRIALRLPEGVTFEEGRLAVNDGLAQVHFSNGATARVWIHAETAVGIIELEGMDASVFQLEAPAFGGQEDDSPAKGFVMGDLAQLGYVPPEESRGDGFMAYVQEGWGGFSFAVHVSMRDTPEGCVAAWSVASSREGEAPAAMARTRAEQALETIPQLRASHADWWRAYWDRAWVRVPDAAIERQWYLDMYKFGAAARRGAPPITLQGPWTADDGKLPPWKGDYHHDLNTQLSYWPCYSGNRLEEGLGFLDWLWENRENAFDWTRRFFDMPGLNVPMTTDLELKQIGGWRQYTHSATTAAWLAHHFYLHWIYSQDRRFLEERAYPWIEECAVFLEAITNERDDAGLRTLPLSSSPEIHDNKPEAWFPTITNYDNALIRWTFEKAAELAEEVNKSEAARRWRAALAEMPPLQLGERGELLVAAGHPLDASHRHFSHLMAIHPLGLIYGPGEESERTIRATLNDLDRLGTDWWTGYSFSWMASVTARAGDGDAAARALSIFAEAFVLRGSFHCNGDQSGKGYSKFSYRPFTLEGNFAAAAGLNEMLLQSHRGVIEVFPAIPEAWENVSFINLRAVGAFLVSAVQAEGRVTQLTIESETGAVPMLRCPWTGIEGLLDSPEMAAGLDSMRDGNRWIITKKTTPPAAT